MNEMRRYIDLLKEGELIPLPRRVLRVPGAPYDCYQLLKMMANPNLAHKVNYEPTSDSKGGMNITDVMIMFYDDISYNEAKKLFDHFRIPYTDAPELSSEIGRTSGRNTFKSTINPPNDADQLFGEYLKPKTKM